MEASGGEPVGRAVACVRAQRALARLAAYEGASYALVPVRLATPRGPMRGRAWIAVRWRAEAQPWPQPERIFRETGLHAGM
jgi:hypothetical protein